MCDISGISGAESDFDYYDVNDLPASVELNGRKYSISHESQVTHFQEIVSQACISQSRLHDRLVIKENLKEMGVSGSVEFEYKSEWGSDKGSTHSASANVRAGNEKGSAYIKTEVTKDSNGGGSSRVKGGYEKKD